MGQSRRPRLGRGGASDLGARTEGQSPSSSMSFGDEDGKRASDQLGLRVATAAANMRSALPPRIAARASGLPSVTSNTFASVAASG